MDAALCKKIVDLSQSLDLDGAELKLREDYSGRGMYGRSTGGIICDSTGAFIQAVAAYAQENPDDDDLVPELRNIRQDSMGRQIIFY
jgi:hypothetical protein